MQVTSRKRPGNGDVYATIRRAISAGELRANEPLREERLASALGVSRTPVREALVRLRAEGLVVAERNGSARVSDLSSDDLEEVFALRETLESLALRYACGAKHDARVAHLRTIHAASVEAVEIDDVERLLELNTEFHAELNRLANRRRLVNFIELLRDQSRRYRVLALYEPSERRKSVEEHGKLLDLVTRGDSAAAVRLLHVHFERPRRRLTAYLGRSGVEPALRVVGGSE